MILLDSTPNIPPININDSLRVKTEDVVYRLQTDPEGYLVTLAHDAIIFGIKVVAALLIYFVGAWLIKKIVQLQKNMYARRKTDPTVVSFVTSATSILLTLLVIIIAVGTLGVDTTSLAALLAAGGMAIGMALSGTVQNFAGGLMILVFKPFKIGDWICAQGNSGTVISVSIVNTKIRTIDNRTVILPNGTLANGIIENHSEQKFRRLDMLISVEYGTNADQCIKLIKQILSQDKRILTSKTKGVTDPFVALKTLNDSDISFVVRAFTYSKDYWDTIFDLNKSIYTILPQNGINFAYPHMDVNLLNLENKPAQANKQIKNKN